MNLIGLCFFIFMALSAGTFSKTISETPVSSREVEKKLDDKMTTLKTIVENSTTDIQDEKSFENILESLTAPANELQDSEEGRTFGVKRLQFMMMPMIYKMGVMMTLLVVLTVISLKGLAIGVLLLVLKLAAFFGKFYASTQPHGPVHGWAPQPPQPVHVHVHNSGGGHHNHPQAYSGWEAASGPPEDEHYYYKG